MVLNQKAIRMSRMRRIKKVPDKVLNRTIKDIYFKIPQTPHLRHFKIFMNSKQAKENYREMSEGNKGTHCL